MGCLKRSFFSEERESLDMNSTVSVVKSCRQKTVWRDKEMLDNYILELFEKSIEKEIKVADGTTKFDMSY